MYKDVIQFVPLLTTLTAAFTKDPLIPIKMIPHVRIPALLDFTYHMFMLGYCTILGYILSPIFDSNSILC